MARSTSEVEALVAKCDHDAVALRLLVAVAERLAAARRRARDLRAASPRRD